MGVDLQEKRKLDAERLADQVALVKARARPWRSIIALALAVAAAAVNVAEGLTSFHVHGQATAKLITVTTAVAFLVFAVGAVVGLAGKAKTLLAPRVGSAHAAVVRYSILLLGSVVTLVITLQLFKIPIGQLVLGGAITGILLGIAAQQTLSNLFAGIVLLLSRPFSVGQRVRVRSGALGGQLDGTVTEIGITYVRLDTGEGVLSLPNAQVLAAAVGPLPAEHPGQPG
ncbi:MAG TPA: mechanosensitive ion channel domain-containing protein [Streptosporangiaceae bacterium]|jgi:small-conductance mechanosensitive channel